MRSYYEISVIDDFGNGSREYFYTDESTIRKLAHKHYTREKKKASVGENEIEEYKNTPLYEWSKDTSTGYVIQHCGFTLKTKVEWKKLDLDLNRYKNTLYVLDNVGHFMVVEHVTVFPSLKKGLNALKELSAKAVANTELAYEDEDGNKVKNGQVRHVIKNNRVSEYLCPYCYWVKTSYEYDEWDIQSTGFILRAKEVKYL